MLSDTEWVLHAATQDLPCLTELGLRHGALFDTELAGRLLSSPRSASARSSRSFRPHAREGTLGRRLVHPAASRAVAHLRRPRRRAAGRAARHARRAARPGRQTGVGDAGVRGAHRQPPRETRRDPWRRTSGIHRVRSRRELSLRPRALDGPRRDGPAPRPVPRTPAERPAIVAAAHARPASRSQLAAIAGRSTPAAPVAISICGGRGPGGPQRVRQGAPGTHRALRRPAAGAGVGRPRPVGRRSARRLPERAPRTRRDAQGSDREPPHTRLRTPARLGSPAEPTAAAVAEALPTAEPASGRSRSRPRGSPRPSPTTSPVRPDRSDPVRRGFSVIAIRIPGAGLSSRPTLCGWPAPPRRSLWSMPYATRSRARPMPPRPVRCRRT